MNFCLKIIFIVQFLSFTHLELFNSIYYLESFLQHEQDSLIILERHVEMEFDRIQHMKNAIEEYKNIVNHNKKFDIDNPVQFYLVLKNIIRKWHILSKAITSNGQEDILKAVNDHREAAKYGMPTNDDLSMSLAVIQKLQQVYNIQHKDIVDGNLFGNFPSKLRLDADDCFKIGLQYYKVKDYNNTYLWLKQALRQFSLEEYQEFDYNSFKKGEKILSQINTMFKNDESFYNYLQSYHKQPTCSYDNTSFEQQHENQNIYESICNAFPNSKVNSTLYCYYKMDRPFLRIAPFKVEVLHLNPDVYLFHQVLTDETSDILVSLAKNKLQQALVGINGTSVKSEHRTAKNAWIFRDNHKIIPILDKRVSDMTNLDTFYAETLQVANYDIGGHYSFHYDALGASLKHWPEDGTNDRIATVLFYLSTPNAGGSTKFHKANLSINAIKNNAIFWYNLLKNGQIDLDTLHGGCPVLSGQKWIGNKWLRQKGQEFLRKCSLNDKE